MRLEGLNQTHNPDYMEHSRRGSAPDISRERDSTVPVNAAIRSHDGVKRVFPMDDEMDLKKKSYHPSAIRLKPSGVGSEATVSPAEESDVSTGKYRRRKGSAPAGTGGELYAEVSTPTPPHHPEREICIYE